MIQKLRNRLSATKRDERGSGELIAFIVAFPIIWFLLMSMIDVSIWLSVRAQVQNAADNGARLSSLYGSTKSGVASWPTAPANANTVEKVVTATIYDGSRCLPTGGCPGGYKPFVQCWFGNSATFNGVTKATVAGERTTCTVRYKFSQVVQGDIFGFIGMTTNEFTVTGYQFSETGFGTS
jgi:hypothetical protein